MLPRRPKPGETEEDLLRYQEEFLAKQGETSTKLVHRGDERKSGGNGDPESVTKPSLKRDVVTLGGGLPTARPDDDIPKKKSKFKGQRKMEKTSKVSGLRGERVHIDLGDDEEDMQAKMDRQDTHITSVLSDIMERDIKDVPVYLPRSMDQAFPSAFHRGSVGDGKKETEKGKKGKTKGPSLFAQHFAKSNAASFGITGKMEPLVEIAKASLPESVGKDVVTMDTVEDMDVEVMDSSEPATLSASGHEETVKKLVGDEEARKIHQENMAKMAAMSEEEILAEQAKLKSMLDPKLVELLTSRNKKVAATHTAVGMDTVEQQLMGISDGSGKPTESEMEGTQESQEEVKLPITPKEEWVHMDTVEKEKLEWMQDVPKPKPGEKKIQGIQARFDLQGHVIGRDADVPMREGLHHHGQEPEAPGYTLEELFQLSRSAAMNQRVISLQTLAKVIYNYRVDNLGGRLGAPLIPRLIDAGIVFILRWSLDDTSEAGIAAAVDGFKSLLVQPADEECLDKVFSWYRGYEMHSLVPMENDDDDDEEEEDEESDTKNKHETELLEQDVIKGLLKMNFLERIRYILEVCRPAPAVVINILAILIRIARHSLESCHEIMKCPRLVATVISSFLPSTWRPTSGSVMENIYGYPVRYAMKLVRVMCTAGRNMAAILLSKYNLMAAIIRYTTQEPIDMQLHVGEAYMLSIESFYTWKICVSYGLASNSIAELYPVFMQHLQLFPRLSVLRRPASEEEKTQALYELQLARSAAVLGLLEMAVHVGAAAAELQSQHSMRSPEGEKKPELPPIPSIDWSHVIGLIAPIELCCQKWMTEITRTDDPLTDCALTLATSCLNIMASFYMKITLQPSYSAIEVLQHIEMLVDGILVPFMKSGNFYSYVINLRTHSSYKEDDSTLSALKTGCKSLPDLRSHPLDERQHPCIQQNSPYGFMGAYLRLIYTWAKMHKGVAAKFSPLIESSYVTSYLEKTCQTKRSAGETLDKHFSRFEHMVLFYVIKIYQLVAQQTDSCHQYSKLYHSVALLLFTSLHPGDEHIAHDLMSTVLFTTDYLVEGRIGDPEAVELAELLRVSDTSTETRDIGSHPSSLHSKQPNRGVLLRDAYNNLASVRACYMTYFGGMVMAVARSRSKFMVIPYEIESHLLPDFAGALVPMDWTFLPLLQLYNQASQAELMGKSMENLPGHYVTGVTNTLRMIYMLETWRPDSVCQVTMAAKITRLMCVFLTGNDLFLEDTVHCYLLALLRLYTQPTYMEKLDFNVPIPGVASFYDLYIVLLHQYGAVSFGDPLFTSFVLLPLQQAYSVQLKKAVWGEHQEVMRSLRVPVRESIIPIERYTTPQETHIELLQMYMSALASGEVRQPWSPVLYLVAVHHVSGFVFGRTDRTNQLLMKAKFRMLRHMMAMTDKEVQKHLLYYKNFNKDSAMGFDLYEEIPKDRQELLHSLQLS